MGTIPLMGRDVLDRLFVERLLEAPPPAYPQSPLQYLLGCWSRSLDEARNRAVAEHPELLGTLQAIRDLVVNYAGLVLVGGGIVPHLGQEVSRVQQQRGRGRAAAGS